jgi:hypothetical protein
MQDRQATASRCASVAAIDSLGWSGAFRRTSLVACSGVRRRSGVRFIGSPSNQELDVQSAHGDAWRPWFGRQAQDSRAQAARRHFDSWSQSSEPDRASRRPRDVRTRTLGTPGRSRSDVMLDLDCATGAEVGEAAAIVTRAVGLDLSPAMMARAHELAATLDNFEFVQVGVSGRHPRRLAL